MCDLSRSEFSHPRSVAYLLLVRWLPYRLLEARPLVFDSKPMSSKLAGALRGSAAKRCGKRPRVAEHLFGPGVHRTFLLAVYIYTFCLQCMVSMGRLDVFRIVNLWTHRAQCLGCVHGMVEACWAIAVHWCAPCELWEEGGEKGVQRSISPRLKVIKACHLKLES